MNTIKKINKRKFKGPPTANEKEVNKEREKRKKKKQGFKGENLSTSVAPTAVAPVKSRNLLNLNPPSRHNTMTLNFGKAQTILPVPTISTEINNNRGNSNGGPLPDLNIREQQDFIDTEDNSRNEDFDDEMPDIEGKICTCEYYIVQHGSGAKGTTEMNFERVVSLGDNVEIIRAAFPGYVWMTNDKKNEYIRTRWFTDDNDTGSKHNGLLFSLLKKTKSLKSENEESIDVQSHIDEDQIPVDVFRHLKYHLQIFNGDDEFFNELLEGQRGPGEGDVFGIWMRCLEIDLEWTQILSQNKSFKSTKGFWQPCRGTMWAEDPNIDPEFGAKFNGSENPNVNFEYRMSKLIKFLLKIYSNPECTSRFFFANCSAFGYPNDMEINNGNPIYTNNITKPTASDVVDIHNIGNKTPKRITRSSGSVAFDALKTQIIKIMEESSVGDEINGDEIFKHWFVIGKIFLKRIEVAIAGNKKYKALEKELNNDAVSALEDWIVDLNEECIAQMKTEERQEIYVAVKQLLLLGYYLKKTEIICKIEDGISTLIFTVKEKDEKEYYDTLIKIHGYLSKYIFKGGISPPMRDDTGNMITLSQNIDKYFERHIGVSEFWEEVLINKWNTYL